MRLSRLIAGLLILAAAPALRAQTAPAPEIGILLPANNARVTSPVTVRFRLANYGVAPAGTNMERTGHFHILIDREAGAPGTVIPADSLHVHYGKGQIEVSVPMTPGRHVLRAVLGDYQHKVIGPELVSAPVTVTVRAPR
ncbi:MAG: DUF4399 domain-containing protein [Gemmatimonadaceae bacterium]|nr:DUF4399 domain-containing protein [Gemmatimonadaceae bacterium]